MVCRRIPRACDRRWVYIAQANIRSSKVDSGSYMLRTIHPILARIVLSGRFGWGVRMSCFLRLEHGFLRSGVREKYGEVSADCVAFAPIARNYTAIYTGQ